jgi:hypothetical protein
MMEGGKPDIRDFLRFIALSLGHHVVKPLFCPNTFVQCGVSPPPVLFRVVNLLLYGLCSSSHCSFQLLRFDKAIHGDCNQHYLVVFTMVCGLTMALH